MRIKITSSGSFSKTERWVARMARGDFYASMERFAQEGVDALEQFTPVDSGLTAQSWTYEISRDEEGVQITWKNTNIVNGFPVAIKLQYGHGTRNGGYVKGEDYINPAMRPTFERIADEVWREVTNG